MAKLTQQGRDLTDLISGLKHPVESVEMRFTIVEENASEYGRQVLTSLENKIRSYKNREIVSPNYEGIRVRCNAPDEQGWFLLRLSLHDPVMPLTIESDIQGGVERIAKQLKAMLIEYEGLKIM